MSIKEKDMMIEREMAAFLDENLYSKNEIFKEFIRTDDEDEQISGSDLLLSTSDGLLNKAVVDEKVNTHYANINLPTFLLELSFINQAGIEMDGWFLDSTKKTEYYLLGWLLKADIPYNPEKKKYDTFSLNRHNVKTLEWVIVSRKKILKFLEDNGWTLDELSRRCQEIRKSEKNETFGWTNNVKFSYSEKHPEKPINVLLRKTTYFELADFKGKISL